VYSPTLISHIVEAHVKELHQAVRVIETVRNGNKVGKPDPDRQRTLVISSEARAC
jgi:hypothetical protein